MEARHLRSIGPLAAVCLAELLTAATALPSTQPLANRLWQTVIAEPVAATPVVDAPLVIVATDTDLVYALDERSGTLRWRRRVGIAEPAGVGKAIDCADVAPAVGVLSTPVVDHAHHVVYLSERSWDAISPASAQWRLHALDSRNGDELPGWPVTVQGIADNDPGAVFHADQELQRPGLLINHGQVFLAFGGICDRPPFRGWIAGVSTATRHVHLWTDEGGGANSDSAEGGIWEAGSTLSTDRGGDIFVATGNGMSPAIGPASVPSATLANSVLRLRVQSDGSLTTVDRFTPAAGDALNAMDLDLGSGGPAVLPDTFGVPGHPHLLIQPSKAGVVYLLDRDHLGGRGQDPEGRDATVAQTGVFEAAFSQPAVWPAGGYVYITGTVSIAAQPRPTLRAYRIEVSRTGGVSLDLAGSAGTEFGYGSGPATLTDADAAQTLVWVLERPAGNETIGELRGYYPTPVSAQLLPAIRIPLFDPAKFSRPVVDGRLLIVATARGAVLAFRLPQLSPPVSAPNKGILWIAAIALAGVTILAVIYGGFRLMKRQAVRARSVSDK
jgi:CBS domain-containing protein